MSIDSLAFGAAEISSKQHRKDNKPVAVLILSWQVSLHGQEADYVSGIRKRVWNGPDTKDVYRKFLFDIFFCFVLPITCIRPPPLHVTLAGHCLSAKRTPSQIVLLVTQNLVRCQNWSGRNSFGCHKWSAQTKTGPSIHSTEDRKFSTPTLLLPPLYGCMTTSSWTTPFTASSLDSWLLRVSQQAHQGVILKSMHIVRDCTRGISIPPLAAMKLAAIRT